jgi:GTP diphosphokinase / guanosine-3',5'-bis(diphosphate) 3'-diphosphatase
MSADREAAALAFIRRAHAKQQRVNGDPYYTHPVAVHRILRQECPASLPEDVYLGALLHDVLEDTGTTFDEVLDLFGAVPAGIADLMAKSSRWSRKDERYYARLRLMHDHVKTVKVADRLHNLREIHCFKSRARMRKYLTETVCHMYPLLETISDETIRCWAVAAIRGAVAEACQRVGMTLD